MQVKSPVGSIEHVGVVMRDVAAGRSSFMRPFGCRWPSTWEVPTVPPSHLKQEIPQSG